MKIQQTLNSLFIFKSAQSEVLPFGPSHPWLSEINAPVGYQEVMSLMRDYPMLTIAGCRLGITFICTWMRVRYLCGCRTFSCRKFTLNEFVSDVNLMCSYYHNARKPARDPLPFTRLWLSRL